ncbi:MAG: nitroreductase family deazaflavin-dependent oxidoreductase [Chloroflexota bacterium]|nr:nitroreductase family deazaflavin-dependent oxidoreductase [Chloroflexota bacterium]
MAEYIASPTGWVAEQVELYESSNGMKGTTLRETGLPVIIVTHVGRKTKAIRKTPLMKVVDGSSYILVASQGGAPKHPVWYHNLKENSKVEIRDEDKLFDMTVREVSDPEERNKLWKIAVDAYPPYQEYQEKTERTIPVFIAESRK